MKRTLKFFIFSFSFLICATGTLSAQEIEITSDPSDAAIYVNGKDTWKSTPDFIPAKGSKMTVELRKMGYENTVQVVVKSPDPETGKKVYPAKVEIKMPLKALEGGSTVGGSHAEDPKYGDTPEQRVQTLKNLNYLQDEINENDFDDAAILVKELMDDAPASTANIYVWGALAYRSKAQRAASLDQKKVYTDSLLLIYDRRVENFGGEGDKGTSYILQLKARDYALTNPMDRAGIRGYFRAALDAAKGAPAGDLVVEYFKNLTDDYKAYEIEDDELLSEFERLVPMMEKAPEADKSNFNTLFAQSGAASCDKLEAIFKAELATKPNDAATLKRAYALMSMINCSSDFYVGVAEKHYAAEPSTPTAIHLASVFEGRKEFEKALKYLHEVLPTETDSKAKANLYVRIAASEIGAGRANAAGSAAREAIALDPANGAAHVFLAEAYIAGAGACGGFTTSTVYWLAYDEYARAKALLAQTNPEQVAHIDSRMASCRSRFPIFEDGFMHIEGYADGKSYYVSCGWISGSTTIRSR